MDFHDRYCVICDAVAQSYEYAASTYDPQKINVFSYASRKIPEFMHHRLLRCLRCDVLYSSPAPQPKYLAEAYIAADYASAPEAQYASHTYIRYLSKYLQKIPELHNALDIGAGDGAFLERLLEAGFKNVAGIEASAAPILQAKQHIAPFIQQGFLMPECYPVNSFNVVSCFQTLEHVDNPKMVGEIVFKLLKPGGIFFVVSHNHRALSTKIMGLKSPIFDIEHLQLFSPKSIRCLLETIGFKKIKIFPIVNRYPLSYWIKVLPLSPGIKNKLNHTMQLMKLNHLPIAIPAGNLGAIGYKEMI